MTADTSPATVLTWLLDAVGCLKERASLSAVSVTAEEVKEAAEHTRPHDSPHHPTHAVRFCGPRTQTHSVFHLAGAHRAWQATTVCTLFRHNRWPAFLALGAALWIPFLTCSHNAVVSGRSCPSLFVRLVLNETDQLANGDVFFFKLWHSWIIIIKFTTLPALLSHDPSFSSFVLDITNTSQKEAHIFNMV